MEAPSSTYAEAIRDEQAKVLRNVRPLDAANMVRGQFRGYRDEPGVAKDSYMATYAALRLHVDSWRWDGVPFFVRAGKCLAKTRDRSDRRAQKRRRRSSSTSRRRRVGNYVRFRLSPQVVIARRRAREAAGRGDDRRARSSCRSTEEPAQGAGRAAWTPTSGCSATRCTGDATLFARQDVVEAAWAIVDPVIHGPSPMYTYEPGTWGPREADALVEEVGGWNTVG